MKLLTSRNKNRRDLRQRKVFFESLESRSLLAGNVLVSVDQATNALLITGDKKDNTVAITENASGDLSLTGTNTKINGQATFDLTAFLAANPNFNGDVDIALGAGNDVL